ncbi:MAG: formylglycine-generating enzyme family protein [Treponema sp.]|nr:formylglycine-generating enzyme family protein [Treponema sp.]
MVCKPPFRLYPLILAACLAPAFSSCEQPPGSAPGEEHDPAPTDGTYTPLGGTEPETIPAGFSWVRGGTVGGSDDYKIAFTYPPGASFEGEQGIQYGAFVSGRVVTIPSFFMARYEVTGSRWREVYDWAVSGDRAGLGYKFANPGSGGGGDEPVAEISWRDAVVWCNAASEKDGLEPVYYTYGGAAILRDATGKEPPPNAPADLAVMKREKNGYRLPTMCEREYAARGGDPRKPDWLYRYAGSDNPDEVAWYYGTSGVGLPEGHKDYGLHPVGQKKPNRLGLYDLSGNVMEWGWDWMRYDANAKLPPMGTLEMHARLDPTTPEEGPPYGPRANQKPMSGGNWHASSPYSLVAIWWGYTTDYHDDKVGFRLARSAP